MLTEPRGVFDALLLLLLLGVELFEPVEGGICCDGRRGKSAVDVVRGAGCVVAVEGVMSFVVGICCDGRRGMSGCCGLEVGRFGGSCGAVRLALEGDCEIGRFGKSPPCVEDCARLLLLTLFGTPPRICCDGRRGGNSAGELV